MIIMTIMIISDNNNIETLFHHLLKLKSRIMKQASKQRFLSKVLRKEKRMCDLHISLLISYLNFSPPLFFTFLCSYALISFFTFYLLVFCSLFSVFYSLFPFPSLSLSLFLFCEYWLRGQLQLQLQLQLQFKKKIRQENSSIKFQLSRIEIDKKWLTGLSHSVCVIPLFLTSFFLGGEVMG